MSVLLIFENKNPIPWKEALEKKLPNISIEIFPDVQDKNKVDFIICWKPQKEIFEQFPNIKVIQSVGASIDHITNTQTLHKQYIISRIVDNKLSNDMWEFLLTIVLNQLKNSTIYNLQQLTKSWEQHNYKSIANTTITILGLGKIGSHVAKKFALLGFTVKGWSASEKKIENVVSFTGNENLVTAIQDSDFLINLLPLTKETSGILNKKTLGTLTSSPFLINVGRGEHIVEDDLIELLNSSILSGALLDVFVKEPLPKEHPFWVHPKIQITPHIASLTNIDSAIHQITKNYTLFTQNKELLHTVSLTKGY